MPSMLDKDRFPITVSISEMKFNPVIGDGVKKVVLEENYWRRLLAEAVDLRHSDPSNYWVGRLNVQHREIFICGIKVEMYE